MDTNKVLEDFDSLCRTGNAVKIEEFLRTNTVTAEREGDWQTQIILQNETIGLYRDLGKFQDGILLFKQTRLLLGEHGLINTIPFASTLINGANLYRAAGQLEEAAFLYEEAKVIYERELDPSDYRFAGFYNNLSLVYREQNQNEKALEALDKALNIIGNIPNTTIEQATTHTTMADLYCQEGNLTKANEHLETAQQLYKTADNKDPHYASFLSTWAVILMAEGNLPAAYETFQKSLGEIEKYFGKNRSYAIVCRNCAAVLDQLGKTEDAEEMRNTSDRILSELK